MDNLFTFRRHLVPKKHLFPIGHRHPGSRIRFHIAFPRPVAPKLTHDPYTSAASGAGKLPVERFHRGRAVSAAVTSL